MTDVPAEKHKANIAKSPDSHSNRNDKAEQKVSSSGSSRPHNLASRTSTGRRRYKRFLARGIVEYERDRLIHRLFKRVNKAKGLLLNMSRGGIQLLVGHYLKKGDMLILTIKLEGIHDSISLKGEVKWSAKVLTQDSYRVGVEFVQYTTVTEKKLRGLESEYLPRHHKLLASNKYDCAQKYPILSDYKYGLQSSHVDDSSSLHTKMDYANLASSSEISPSGLPSNASETALSASATIEQSTSLQSLSGITEPGKETEPTSSITQFDEIVEEFKNLEVDDRLIMDVFETLETGMDLNGLFKSESTSIVAPSSTASNLSAASSALGEIETDEQRKLKGHEGPRNLIPVYRLDSRDGDHFDDGLHSTGTPVAHIFISRVQNKGSLFSYEIGNDSMEQNGTPSFEEGNILIFSSKEKVENGDYAFIKIKRSQSNAGVSLFRQVFFDDADSVRLRPLNNKYREEIYSQQDIEFMWKMIGRYEDF